MWPGSSSPGPWDAARADAAKAPQPPREVVELRSAKSKTIRQPDGRLRTTLSPQSLHYYDSTDKTWKDIDGTFEDSQKQGIRWESGKNRFSVELSATSKTGFLTFASPNGEVSLSLEGASAVAGQRAQENAVTFKGALKDVDLEYTVLPDGLKESIVLRERGAPSDYRFRLVPAVGQRLRTEERDDGSVWFFRESFAEPALVLLPPVVGDSSDQATPQPDSALTAPPSWASAPGKASMKVEANGDEFIIELEIDEQWLESPERVFPVVLDPTLYVQPDSADGEYNTTAGGVPNVSAPEIRTGRDGAGGPKYASALSFDLGTIPPGATVLDARLNAFLNACFPTTCGTGHTGNVELRRLNSPGWSSSTAWASVSVNPTTQGTVSFTGTPNATWQRWSGGVFTDTVQAIVNGSAPNYGFILEKNGGNDAVGYKWRSARWSDPSFAPFLEVYWVGDGVQVDPAVHVHSNGAELVWQHYAGGTSAYADAVLGDDPRSYWRLDEGAGPDALDWSGKDTTATYSGGYTLGVPGNLADLDTAVTFNGSNGQASASGISLAGQSFSLEAWARRNSVGSYDWIAGQGTGAQNQGLHFGFRNTNEFTCAFWANDLNTPQYTDSNWHHWVCTFDAATGARRIYRDGSLVANDTAAAYQGTGVFLLGNHPALTGAFDGTLDEVAVYPTALSQAQVSAHYAAASTPMPGFQRFEVHRSATPNFAPSASTLIGTIAEVVAQTFRDTTAKPSATFYYRVVTVTSEGSFSSNEVKADLPASGLGQVTIQPGYISTSASATHISSGTPNTEAGSSQSLVVGSSGSNHTRVLIAFDMRPVPTGAEISSAQLQMYALGTTPAGVNAHRLTANWFEGGATWNAREKYSNLLWQTPGGDFDSSVAGSSAGGSNQHWDSWSIGSLVEEWVQGQKAHHGLLLKYGSENGTQPTLTYAADGFVRAIALRPKLVVTYEDGSQAVAPTVAVSQPQPGDLVKGQVTVKAGALDDGAVASVQFKLDGGNLGPLDTVPPFEVAWDTTAVSRGSHALSAVATDEAGNATSAAAIEVLVANSGAPNGVAVTNATAGGGSQPAGDPSVPLGTVVPYLGASVPSGWLLAEGGCVSQATYADLYDLVDSSFGSGCSAGEFRLPDLRGRLPLGKASSGTGSTLGSSGGSLGATGSATVGPVPYTFSWTEAPANPVLAAHSHTWCGAWCITAKWGGHTVIRQATLESRTDTATAGTVSPSASGTANVTASWSREDPAFGVVRYVVKANPAAVAPSCALWHAASGAPSGTVTAGGAGATGDLAACIDPAFGGNVPDLRRRFALGKAASGTGSTLNGAGGAFAQTATVTLNTASTAASVTATPYSVGLTLSNPTHSVSVPTAGAQDSGGETLMHGVGGQSVGSTNGQTISSVAYNPGTLTSNPASATQAQSSTFSAPYLGVETFAHQQAGYSVQPGTVVAYSGLDAPEGWLVADGSCYPASDHPALVAKIGYLFGGSSDEDEFCVPDLRGRIPITRASSGVGPWLGTTGGSLSETPSATLPGWTPTLTVPAHAIQWNVPAHTHTIGVGPDSNGICTVWQTETCTGVPDAAYKCCSASYPSSAGGGQTVSSNIGAQTVPGNAVDDQPVTLPAQVPPHLVVTYLIASGLEQGSGGPPNVPPTATAAGSPLSGPAPLTVNFTGSGSDSDGSVTAYEWDLDGDGAYDDAAVPNPSFQYTTNGVYYARLRVTDSQGAFGFSTPLTITVAAPPSAPNVVGTPFATSANNPTSGTWAIPSGWQAGDLLVT